MMLGEGHRPNPTIHIPPWPLYDDPTAGITYSFPVSGVSGGNGTVTGGGGGGGNLSPYLLGEAALEALQRFLPSNEPYLSDDSAGDDSVISADSAVDAYSCDEFRMYEFKVRRCARGRSHDWTECPYAHPGEKARRRDPHKFHYSGTACPDFRKGSCKRGDACEFAHGVFECWLHPARYRTQPCKDGVNCRRRVCFFAHTPDQLRVLPPPPQQSQSKNSPRTPRGSSDSYDGCPLRHRGLNLISLTSPPSSPPSDSPPLSPNSPSIRRGSVQIGGSMNEVLASLRHLQIRNAQSPPSSWGTPVAGGIGSPRDVGIKSGFFSWPTTPTRVGMDGVWEEPMERVESGRDLRAKIFEKLSRENSMDRVVEEEEEEEEENLAVIAPDVGWVSELVK